MPEHGAWNKHTDIPALSEEDAQTEQKEDNASTDPSVCLVWR